MTGPPHFPAAWRVVLALLLAACLAAGVGAAADATPEAARIDAISEQAPGLRSEVLRLAVRAAACAAQRELVKRPGLLTVIDYSLPSTETRLWVVDLSSPRVLFAEHVAHGRNSGENHTTQFSNRTGSLQTSLGLFVTEGTYVGRNGYSLRLDGLEEGINHRARQRAIVMHGAPYVDPTLATTQGRLGRSWGCPAVRQGVAKPMIDTIKGGSALFAYYPDEAWLAASEFLNGCGTRAAAANDTGN